MKRSISLALLTTLFVAACSEPEPPPRRQRAAIYQPAPETEYPPVQQPFDQNVPPPPPPDVAASQIPPPDAAAVAPVKPTKGDFPYGIPVPDKPGFVKSPYAPDAGLVDVRGFPPGSEVHDPYTQKIMLVP